MNIKNSFGLAIEGGSFYENLTVKENLVYFGRLYHVPKKVLIPRVEGLMKFVGLTRAEAVLSKNLSLGMKKRLDIACALVHNPHVLILDEPTADLDPLLRFQIMKLIKKINSHGTTIVFTTQLLSEADKICDKVAILYNEKIIEQESSSKLKTKYHSNDLDGVFRKIFSKKGRKTYQESIHKKTKFEEPSHEGGSVVIEEEPKKDSEDSITREELEEVLISKKSKKSKNKGGKE